MSERNCHSEPLLLILAHLHVSVGGGWYDLKFILQYYRNTLLKT